MARAYFFIVLLFVMLLVPLCPLAAVSIERQVLPSGLTVVVAEHHVTALAVISVAVRAGPLHEGEWLGSGLSLVTQRLIAAAGIGDTVPPQSAKDVREAWARLGDRFSARTTSDAAIYSVAVPSAAVPQALTLLAGLMRAPTFGADEVERERQQLALTSIGSTDELAINALLFRCHPARLPIAGLPSMRDQITLGAVNAYRVARYRAGNTVLVVAGNVNTGEVLRQALRLFVSFPVGGLAPLPVVEEPPQLSPRYDSIAVPGTDAQMPRMIQAWRTVPMGHPDQAALFVMAQLLTGSRGWLARTYVSDAHSEKTIVGDVLAASVQMPGQIGFFRIAAVVPANARAEADQALAQTLARVAARPLDVVEVASARALAVRALGEDEADAQGVAASALNWELALGDATYGKHFVEAVRAVNAADLMRVAGRYLSGVNGENGRCTVVVRAPEAPVVGNVQVPPVESDAPAQIVPMAKGLRLFVHASDAAAVCHVHLLLGGGASVENELQQGATAQLAQVMVRATETRTPDDIEAILRHGGMRVQVNGGMHALDIGLVCLPEDLPSALDLVIDWLTSAALPPDEIERARSLVQRDLADDLARCDGRLMAEVRRLMFDGHYASRNPAARDSRDSRDARVLGRDTADAASRLDRQVLHAHYRRLAVGANAMIVITGRCDATVVEQQVTALIAAHPDFVQGEALRPVGTAVSGRNPPPLNVGDHDVCGIALAWAGPTLEDQQRDGAVIAVLAALIDHRVNQALSAAGVRQDLQVTAEAYDRRGVWVLHGPIDDSRREVATQAARDEMAALTAQFSMPDGEKGVLSDADLATAKARALTTWALALKDTGHAAALQAISLLLSDQDGIDANFSARLASVTRRDLARLAQPLLREPITVVLKPRAESRADNAAVSRPAATLIAPIAPTDTQKAAP